MSNLCIPLLYISYKNDGYVEKCPWQFVHFPREREREREREIDSVQFYVPFKNFSLIWRRHHCRCRAAKFRPMLGAQGLWAGRDLYRATPAVTGPRFFRSHPKDCPIQSPLTTRMGTRRTYSNPDPHGAERERERERITKRQITE